MISSETVSRVLENMSTMSNEQAQAMVVRMGKEQPEALAYLLAMPENEAFDQDESEVFLYIGIVIWQLMKQNPDGCRRVTKTQMEKAERANEDLLEKMASDSTGDLLSAAESMIEGYPEPELLRYMTGALMEDEDGNPDNPPIREETLGPAFLHLKIVMDAFIGK